MFVVPGVLWSRCHGLPPSTPVCSAAQQHATPRVDRQDRQDAERRRRGGGPLPAAQVVRAWRARGGRAARGCGEMAPRAGRPGGSACGGARRWRALAARAGGASWRRDQAARPGGAGRRDRPTRHGLRVRTARQPRWGSLAARVRRGRGPWLACGAGGGGAAAARRRHSAAQRGEFGPRVLSAGKPWLCRAERRRGRSGLLGGLRAF